MPFQNIASFKEKGVIGVIGGAGRMGQWALKLFNSLGYKNLFFYDIIKDSAKIEELTGAKFVENSKALAKISDFLIISVPLSKTLKVIDEVGPHIKKDTIFSDFTSVKRESCKKMEKYSKKVIGIHPMFKDSVKNLKNKNIVLTPQNPGIQEMEISLIKQIFEETGAKIRVISPGMHDKITSFNQTAVHLILVTYGNLLKNYCRKNNLSLAQLESLDTPNSQIMNLLLGRFLSTKNYEVIWGIQNSTKESREIRQLFLKNTQKITTVLDTKDSEQFEKDLISISRKFKKTRVLIESEDSDELVRFLKEFGSEKHFEDLNQQTKELLGELSQILTKIEISDEKCKEEVSNHINKVNNLFLEIEDSFRYKDFKDSIKKSLSLKKFISNTLLSGKRRWYETIKKNNENLEKICNLINDLVNNLHNLIELDRLISP